MTPVLITAVSIALVLYLVKQEQKPNNYLD
jgi:hypothetical protein